jgi:hypothetical protein
MALQYFYGELFGRGRRSTRPGNMSGLTGKLHSKQGTVVVELSERSGIDHAKVYLTAHPTTGKGTERVLYDGPIAGHNAPDVVLKLPSRAAREVVMPDPEILSAGWFVPDYVGTLDPTGEESDWDNDAKQATGPRRSVGKLHLQPDPAD